MTKFFVLIATCAVLLTSCYTDYGLATDDYRTVITIYDTTAGAFDGLQNFYLIDSVFHVLGDTDGVDEISRKYDQQLIDGVASNLISMGWTQVTDTNGAVPHTTVRISALKNVTIGYYYSYWYPWYGYGWGYWGWYYPPYYPSGSYYTYTTGSVVVEMDKVREIADKDSLEMRAIWIGSSNGLLSSAESSNVQYISAGVRQMFTQSPYLYRSSQP